MIKCIFNITLDIINRSECHNPTEPGYITTNETT